MVADWTPVNLFGILDGASFSGVSGSAIIMENGLWLFLGLQLTNILLNIFELYKMFK